MAVLDARNGVPLMTLDGPMFTKRRTAAVFSLSIRTLQSTAASALVVGTGNLVWAHIGCMARVNATRSYFVHGSQWRSCGAGSFRARARSALRDFGRSPATCTASTR